MTSLYLTPWSLGAGDNVAWQRFATTLLGIATVAVIGLVGRRLAGPQVGLVAAAIAAVYPNLWINDSLVMSESLAVLIVAVALLVALDFDRRPGGGRAVVLGVLVGLGALTRSEIAVFAVGFAGLAWWRAAGHPRRALMPVLVVGATFVTIAPWTLYNVGRFDRPVLLSTNDGTTLLGANCDTTYYDDIGGWDIRCLAPVPTTDAQDASERSVERRDIAVDYIGDHVGRLPVVVVARGRTDARPLRPRLPGRARPRRGEGRVGGVGRHRHVLGARAWPRSSGGGPSGVPTTAPERSRARWWLVVPLAAVLVTTVLFYGAHRIRAPAEPVLVVLGAVGLLVVRDRRRRPDVQPI